LGDGQHRQERKTEQHDATTSDTHETTAFTHAGVHIRDEVHLVRHRLADSGGDISQLRKESRMLSRLKRRAGRLESLRSRENRPEDHARADEAKQAEPIDAVTVDPEEPDHEQQDPRDPERQAVKADR